MAVVVDATAVGSSDWNSGEATFTWDHTCAADAGVLVVQIGGQNTINPSGVTYNGVAMTKLVDNANNEHASIWYLLEPDSGTHAIVVTKGAGRSNDYAGAASISFTGADAIAQTLDTTGTSGTSFSVTNVTSQAEGITVTTLAFNDPSNLVYTGGGTEYESPDIGPTKAQRFVYNAFSGGANEAESWTVNVSRTYDAVGAEVYQSGTDYEVGLDEAITLADSLIRTTGKSVSEAVVLVDSISRSLNRAVAEIVTVIDGLAKQGGRVLLDSLSLTDSIANLRTKAATLVEAVTIIDSFNRVVERAFNEVLTLVDIVANQLIVTRSFVESLTVEEVFTIVRTAFATLVEAIAPSDSISFYRPGRGLLRGIQRLTGTKYGSQGTSKGIQRSTNTKIGTHKDE